VRYRSSEGSHDGIADELLDRAAEALDLLAQASVVGAKARTHVLRVLPLGLGREADEIAEEDGDDLPFLEHRGRLHHEARATEPTEREALRIFPAAGRADEHGRECRSLDSACRGSGVKTRETPGLSSPRERAGARRRGSPPHPCSRRGR
jgi:hypothetical protein